MTIIPHDISIKISHSISKHDDLTAVICTIMSSSEVEERSNGLRSDLKIYCEPNPHYWTNGNGRNGNTIYDLTAEEIEAYHLGYNNQHNRR